MSVCRRLVSIVLVRDGFVVNSYGFSAWSRIGQLRFTLLELQRWQVDEICVVDISPIRRLRGPNLDLIDQIASLELMTPFAYGGGISTLSQAEELVRRGVDRLLIGRSAFESPHLISDFADVIGQQAIILSVPFRTDHAGVEWVLPHDEVRVPISSLTTLLPQDWRGELLLQHMEKDGAWASERDFDSAIDELSPLNLCLFGGLRDAATIGALFRRSNVTSVAIGNHFHSSEIASPRLKRQLPMLRPFVCESAFGDV